MRSRMSIDIEQRERALVKPAIAMTRTAAREARLAQAMESDLLLICDSNGARRSAPERRGKKEGSFV